MARTLHVRVDGVARMIAAWVRYREVFRADWWGFEKYPNMRVFSPFAASCERLAPKQADGSRVLSAKDWIAELGKGGQDDLDLRLHEVVWHGILRQKDAAGVSGIGSNDMARRAATTTPQQRADYRARFLEEYDTVVIHGVP